MGSTVFLVGVDNQFLGRLEARLARIGMSVSRSTSGHDVLEHVEQWNFELLIAEAQLMGMDAIELCRQLRNRLITVPILVCTDAEMPIEAVLVYEAGADCYFNKSTDWVVIEAIVRSALRRCEWHHQEGDSRSASESPPKTGRLQRIAFEVPGFSIANLTRFEERLLNILKRTYGHVVSKPVIVEEIWGASRVPANSLYELISTLRSKLRAAGWTIDNVRGMGYRLTRHSNNEVPVSDIMCGGGLGRLPG